LLDLSTLFIFHTPRYPQPTLSTHHAIHTAPFRRSSFTTCLHYTFFTPLTFYFSQTFSFLFLIFTQFSFFTPFIFDTLHFLNNLFSTLCTFRTTYFPSYPKTAFLRGSDCKYRESLDKLKKSKILITCQKNTFGELYSKILLKPSGILLFSRNSEKTVLLN